LQRVNVKSATDSDIAKRAYQKYEARGRTDGFDREDWAAAAHELRAEAMRQTGPAPSHHGS
jgi:hypothetical protein